MRKQATVGALVSRNSLDRGTRRGHKAAVEAMTPVLAKELRGRSITVNAIAPGPTATDLFLNGKSPD